MYNRETDFETETSNQIQTAIRSRPRMEKQQGWNSLKNGFWISRNNLGVGK